ncbi:DNA-binding PadR family transcriptional regulator [Natronobacillus azotifigens]|uniref:YkyA family protein n=1 Tax=Natronobacillus azotifigens TaxID=472978 RepID=A0A9J6REU0_9BACI|nr:YkyA family protein [Natronobacillus azotifigens]MCZ0703965.1 YkyA family protein [Natronobacillus azotifigens]
MRAKLLGIIATVSILLVACANEPTTEEDMFEHMEESVRLEQDFVAQQQPLTELEAEEQAIYEEISELGMDEYETINELADQAIASIEERQSLTEIERTSIEAAKEEFDRIEPLIAELEDETLQAQAREMFDAMEERYQAFLSLNDAYRTSLDYDQELYQLLKQEDLDEEQFTEQIDIVNSQYQEVIEANQLFNEKTDEFNSLKRAFYDASDLNVTYE